MVFSPRATGLDFLLLLTCASILGVGAASSWSAVPADPEVRIGPVPPWVAVETLPERVAAADGEKEDNGDGIAYLLSDEIVDLESETRYQRTAYTVTASHGLDDAASVEAEFDPTYQQLTWHGVTVFRDGQAVYQLDVGDVEMSRRYEDLDWSIYDNSYTAFIILKDLRVGDVVDFSYSVVGFNPVFGRKLSERAYLQWTVPVQLVRREYRVPEGRRVFVQTDGTVVPARVFTKDGVTVHQWRMENVPAADYDWDAPPDWNPYARVELTEFANWGEVVEWALPLYPYPEDDAALRASIPADIWQRSTDPVEQAEALLRFVQEDIRYLSVVVGEGSHRPSLPDVCVSRRFGDCKDKAFLLCSLLRPLGIDAVPALVSTEEREAISRRLPAPTVFDHVIVRLDLPDGRRCWVDPTETHDGGRLWERAIGQYGWALPIAPGIGGLEEVPEPAAALDATEVHEEFIVRSFDGPAHLEVSTRYRGRAADRMRESLEGTNRNELAGNLRDYYAKIYPEISERRPFALDDDRSTNELVLREFYTIERFWEKSEETETYHCTVFPQAVYDRLHRPAKTMRASPYKFDHPFRVKQDTVLRLPDSWRSVADKSPIDNEWFRLEIKSQGSETGFAYSTLLESKKGRVEAADVPEFAREVDHAIEVLGYDLTWTPPSTVAARVEWKLSWLRVAASPIVFGLFVAVFITWARRQGPPRLPGNDGPEGIGGWLILPLIHIVIRGIAAAVGLVQGRQTYFYPDVWNTAVATVDPAWQSVVDIALWIEVFTVHAILANVVVVVPLFFRKHRAVPKLATTGYALMVTTSIAGAVALHLFDGVTSQERVESVRDVIVTTLGLVVWGLYFYRSRRVKNTFRL